ncbi:MAG: PAS domain-containing protein [Bacteroidetes bacterium]|nr:PAS domain-containing protein [Bacteroidota bacterium]
MYQNLKAKSHKTPNSIAETEMHALFFDAADQMFVLCDDQLTILYVNQTTCDKFKVKKELLVGRNISEFGLDPVENARIELYQSALLSGKPITLDVNITHPELSHLYTRIKAVKSGNNIALFITDITELKLMRDEHKFLTNLAASEIKHPLTRLMYLTNEALKSDIVNQEGKNYFKEINREMINLDGTLHHVMDVTGTTLQNVVFQTVDLDNVLENVLLMFSMNPSVEEVEFQREVNIQNEFISDVNAIFYVLYELIENAIFFRKPKEFKPLVKVKFVEKEENFVLTVQDNGIGIAPQKLDNLFVFKTEMESKPKMIGFGLFTVYKLVNKLNGVIKVKSKPRKGTTIDIYLPKINS